AEPAGGTHRAAHEHVAAHGPMGDLYALPLTDKIDSVLADDITAAHRLHADLLFAALAAHPFTMEVGDLVVIAAKSFGDDLAHAHRRAARRVLLLVVMEFDNLDIKVVAEGGGNILEELEAEIDADAHIRSENDRDGARILL